MSMSTAQWAPSWRRVEAAWRTGSASCVGCGHRRDVAEDRAVVTSCTLLETGAGRDWQKCRALKALPDAERMALPASPAPVAVQPTRIPRDLFDTVEPIVIGRSYVAEVEHALMSIVEERLQRSLLTPATAPRNPRALISRIIGFTAVALFASPAIAYFIHS